MGTFTLDMHKLKIYKRTSISNLPLGINTIGRYPRYPRSPWTPPPHLRFRNETIKVQARMMASGGDGGHEGGGGSENIDYFNGKQGTIDA